MGSRVEDIQNRLKTIVAYVRDCETRVVRGDIPDMQGLDNKVTELCEEIATLPRSEGREMEHQMSQLVESLDMLAVAMKEQQDQLAEAAGGKG